MDVSIIVALILGFASIISSICFGLVPTIRRTKVEKLEEKIQRLLKDIKLYYYIEEELLERLEKCSGQNKKTTKETVRKMIEDRFQDITMSYETKPSVFDKQIK